MHRIRFALACLALSAVVITSVARGGQEPNKSRARPPNQPAETGDKVRGEPAKLPESKEVLDSGEAELRQAVTGLTEQLRLLTTEIRRLRGVNERNSARLELLLSEDRLTRLEDKIADAQERKAQLDAREQEIQFRMRNIQQEVILRGGLRRDEAEAAIRADFQRSLEDVRKQQASLQSRIPELQGQAERLRRRIESLRKATEPNEDKPPIERKTGRDN